MAAAVCLLMRPVTSSTLLRADNTCMPSVWFMVTLIMPVCPPLCPHSLVYSRDNTTPPLFHVNTEEAYNSSPLRPPGKIWSQPDAHTGSKKMMAMRLWMTVSYNCVGSTLWGSRRGQWQCQTQYNGRYKPSGEWRTRPNNGVFFQQQTLDWSTHKGSPQGL